jgi:nucleoside-triphosphatase
MARSLLLTGRPGVGKTTVVKAVAALLGERAGGFYTEEMRREGRREGFRLVTLDGRKAVMAHVQLRGPGRPSVGRYGVDVQAIQSVGVAALERAVAAGQIVIVDEIGKMELFCEGFKQALLDAVGGPQEVVAAAMTKPNPWVDRLKALQHVETWHVSAENRDQAPQRVLAWLGR